MAKKKQQQPKRMKFKRKVRLQSASIWLKTYQGKHLVRSYRKRYGVDILCAITELQMLGVKMEASYIEAVKSTIAGQQQRKAKKGESCTSEYSDERFAYIAGYTGWGFPYGITWEEMGEEPPDFD